MRKIQLQDHKQQKISHQYKQQHEPQDYSSRLVINDLPSVFQTNKIENQIETQVTQQHY